MLNRRTNRVSWIAPSRVTMKKIRLASVLLWTLLMVAMAAPIRFSDAHITTGISFLLLSLCSTRELHNEYIIHLIVFRTSLQGLILKQGTLFLNYFGAFTRISNQPKARIAQGLLSGGAGLSELFPGGGLPICGCGGGAPHSLLWSRTHTMTTRSVRRPRFTKGNREKTTSNHYTDHKSMGWT